MEADPEVLACRTLKLILQPIIENSIVHGIEQMVDEGQIDVRAYLKKGHLIFKVTDNGLGIPPAKLAELSAGLAGTLPREKDDSADSSSADTYEGISSGSGVGVYNVSERIRIYYGAEYGLTYESELEEGTTVTIEIPFITQEDEK